MTETLTFRGPQVCALAGVTYRQLDHWCRTGILRPSVADARGSGTLRLFSRRDACIAWVLGQLSSLGRGHLPDLGCLRTIPEWRGWLVVHGDGVDHVLDPDLLGLWPVAFVVDLGACPLVAAPTREGAIAS